ncbi:MAG TPA: 2-oxoacid:acceptor oxidoreductase subunit alpha [Planctomycetota bacterium]|nr:2-oxoacid:acceptor oxidoreductase subunit alpha [Planctomycetota bacterium]
MTHTAPARALQRVEDVVIRFAGDSGDGMQLTGDQFTRTTAIMGNDIATFPDFPAEIRAPAGTLPGVSAFQLRFSSHDIHTPGSVADVLVAMNPAALKVHIKELKPGGILIVNPSTFKPTDLKKAKWDSNPLEDGSLQQFRVIPVELDRLTKECLAGSGLDNRTIDRCKNMFALGILYWLYHRDMEPTLRYIDARFGSKNPALAEANKKVLQAGYTFAEANDLFQTAYEVPPAPMAPGLYRNIMGNQALCLGLVAAAKKAGLQMFVGSYPITPASDILHQLSTYKHHGVITFQAEDEIAAVGAAIGASYGGKLGVTSTSGPGLALKAEAIGLAVMVELPLVVIDVQRAGPSTGMPTKTEQADLLQAMFGRNGECPVAVVAASSPADAFEAAYEAVRIAVKYMVPVILLSDGSIANGSEPWLVPAEADLSPIEVRFATPSDTGARFMPYARDPETLARPWAVPGTPGLQHRIGGIEKEDVTGNISYDPQNHEHMVRTRAQKVAGIAADIPPLRVEGPQNGDVLVLGWGCTRGAIVGAVRKLQEAGHKVAFATLRHLNPFPANLGDVLRSFKKVIVPELNLGQLTMLLRARYLVDAQCLSKVQGRPFTREEIEAAVLAALGS